MMNQLFCIWRRNTQAFILHLIYVYLKDLFYTVSDGFKVYSFSTITGCRSAPGMCSAPSAVNQGFHSQSDSSKTFRNPSLHCSLIQGFSSATIKGSTSSSSSAAPSLSTLHNESSWKPEEYSQEQHSV